MKKFLVLSALVITSCTLSNEEKAEKLVKETLKDYLYHPDSYEPISTRVDSMFIDVTTIEPIMKISDEIKNLISKINRCERKIESAESSMDLKSATKLFSVLLASKRPLITELADKLRLKYPLLPTISPCPTMRLEAIRSIIPISCRRYPKSV